MFRFLLRFLGLTGLVLAGVGAVGLASESDRFSWDVLRAAIQGQRSQLEIGASYLLVGGLAVAGVVLLFELLGTLRQSAGRRSALGTNAMIQIGLASALLIGVNVCSFKNYRRWDCTRNGEFTLPAEVASELKKLRGETTVVVYLQHATGEKLSNESADDVDGAAESKIVEKIRDLVDQIKEFGPQFRVVVLDTKDKKFKRKRDAEEANFKGLIDAMKATPENSIFFCDQKKIQRMAFPELYQLDKTASQSANDGRGNLVLHYQGVEPFARRILAIEEKRPRIAIAVSHPFLSTEGQLGEYTLAGVRTALTRHGFSVRDIFLNKFAGRRGRGLRLEKSAMSIEENRFELVEVQLTAIRMQIIQGRAEIEQGKELLSLLKSDISAEDLDRKLSARLGQRVTMSEEMKKRNVTMLSERIPEIEQELAKTKDKERSLEQDLDQLQGQESVSEGQRQTDLKKKLASLLSDCDALILPRMTLVDTSFRDVPNSLHQLDENQLAAIKEFMKAGKPVLFCFGPTNEPADPSDPPDRKPPPPPPDNLENLLGQVGFVFAPQAVLFD